MTLMFPVDFFLGGFNDHRIRNIFDDFDRDGRIYGWKNHPKAGRKKTNPDQSL